VKTLKKPRVSVVTAFYNRGALVAESIDSLLTQTLEDIEIIIVDDGSTDDTAARLNDIKDERVRIISQANAGFTSAITRAVAESAGDYVALHGAGDLSRSRRLSAQADYLDANDAVGVVGCRYTNDDVVVHLGVTTVERAPLLETFMKGCRISHGEVMFRRTLYDRVGGYRRLFTYAQDMDLWLRMGEFCDYAILPEILYDRRRLSEGVYMSPHAFYMQRKLARVAVECVAQRQKTGRDMIDRIGAAALFLSEPDRALSRTFTRRSLDFYAESHHESGIFMARMGWREWRDHRSFAGLVLAWLATGQKRRHLLGLFLKYRARSRAKRSSFRATHSTPP
jgi:glycosyltransferase involved in cell wall biosynthesis